MLWQVPNMMSPNSTVTSGIFARSFVLLSKVFKLAKRQRFIQQTQLRDQKVQASASIDSFLAGTFHGLHGNISRDPKSETSTLPQTGSTSAPKALRSRALRASESSGRDSPALE